MTGTARPGVPAVHILWTGWHGAQGTSLGHSFGTQHLQALLHGMVVRAH